MAKNSRRGRFDTETLSHILDWTMKIVTALPPILVLHGMKPTVIPIVMLSLVALTMLAISFLCKLNTLMRLALLVTAIAISAFGPPLTMRILFKPDWRAELILTSRNAPPALPVRLAAFQKGHHEAGRLAEPDSQGRVVLAGLSASELLILVFVAKRGGVCVCDCSVACHRSELGERSIDIGEGRIRPCSFVGRVYFSDNSSRLTKEAKSIIDQRITAAVRQRPGCAVIVLGNTDSRGDDAYNMLLGQERSASVCRRLVEQDIGSDMVLPVTCGEMWQAVRTMDEADHAKNRRVDILIVSMTPSIREYLASVARQKPFYRRNAFESLWSTVSQIPSVRQTGRGILCNEAILAAVGTDFVVTVNNLSMACLQPQWYTQHISDAAR